MKKPGISVALCTCNGAAYIAHQIESILAQSVKVDEIVVCDDRSTDDTISIVKQYQNQDQTHIQCFVNDERLGSSNNFQKAVSLCNGDVIFLSDQDDIWLPRKVEVTMQWFEEHNQCDMVFSNGYYMDNDEQAFTKRTMFDAVAFTPLAQWLFNKGFQLETLLPHNRCTGAAMAFRKSIVPQLQFSPKEQTDKEIPLHDYAMVLTAASMQKLGFIVEPLIRYRIHPDQQQGFGAWLRKPPTTANVLKPRRFDDIKLQFVSEGAMQRALFYKQRRQFRNILQRWKVLAHCNEYKRCYGKYYLLPLVYDLLRI